MFRFFKKSIPSSATPDPVPVSNLLPPPGSAATPAPRANWLGRLRSGLRQTSSSLSSVFVGAHISPALYDELETALLVADTGVEATNHLLNELKQRVKSTGQTDPAAVKTLLAQALTELLQILEKPLEIGVHRPTVIMLVGVNGAGKTTSIGKLTRHLTDQKASVLLAAADTFRAAAREQLMAWADRNTVEIISQEGGDPAAVSFNAVSAGKARGNDVVLIDTAGRLPTQTHLMQELQKIKRTITKAGAATAPTRLSVDAQTGTTTAEAAGAPPPHEILLVIDGNTGQNALAQVQAFDATLTLTGLIITKLDGTAKGGVVAAIALWARKRAQQHPTLGPVPVYFIGVGEQLQDLQTFSAEEFAQALLD